MKQLVVIAARAMALAILLPLGIHAMPAQALQAGGNTMAGLYPPTHMSPINNQPITADVPARAAGALKIAAFYTVSQVDALDWAKLNYPTPSKTTTFPAAQTWWVPLYFVYSGAVAKVTKYGGDVRNAAGAVVASAGPYTLGFKGNQQEFYISRAHKVNYPNGVYTAELTSGGNVVATTTFRVGDSAPSGGFKITTFYPISQTDNNNWQKLNYAKPGAATSFTLNQTWWVPFYLAYSGAVPKTTKYSGSVRDSTGALVATAGPYTLPDESNVQEFFIGRANKVVYAVGAYTAEVTSAGKVMATTKFTIGGPPMSTAKPTVSTFYTISNDNYNNWEKLKYATPALVTSFTYGKTWWIPFFFAYSGAVAKSTKFNISIKNSAGKVVKSNSPNSLAYPTSTQETYVARSKTSPYPIGAYTAELHVGGKILATTSFIVGR